MPRREGVGAAMGGVSTPPASPVTPDSPSTTESARRRRRRYLCNTAMAHVEGCPAEGNAWATPARPVRVTSSSHTITPTVSGVLHRSLHAPSLHQLLPPSPATPATCPSPSAYFSVRCNVRGGPGHEHRGTPPHPPSQGHAAAQAGRPHRLLVASCHRTFARGWVTPKCLATFSTDMVSACRKMCSSIRSSSRGSTSMGSSAMGGWSTGLGSGSGWVRGRPLGPQFFFPLPVEKWSVGRPLCAAGHAA